MPSCLLVSSSVSLAHVSGGKSDSRRVHLLICNHWRNHPALYFFDEYLGKSWCSYWSGWWNSKIRLSRDVPFPSTPREAAQPKANRNTEVKRFFFFYMNNTLPPPYWCKQVCFTNAADHILASRCKFQLAPPPRTPPHPPFKNMFSAPHD